MKKSFITCIIGLLAITFCMQACKDYNAFTISGIIKNPASIKTVYLLGVDSTTITKIDSTQLSENGEFKFHYSAPSENLYRLAIGGSMFDLIAKNGDDISFTTDINDVAHTYQISGSDESQKIKDFNKISNVYSKKNNELYAQFQEKAKDARTQADSMTLFNAYRPIFQKNVDDQSAAVLKFVNENKNSLAGFYAATSLDPDKYEQQLIAYSHAINGKFTNNLMVRQFLKQMKAAEPLSIGHKAPEFTIIGIDDKPIKLSDYKGKYVMLDFWASWCQPCRQENPNVVKQYNAFHGKGLNILGISLDTSKPDWQQAINTDHLTWAHASDLKNFYGSTEQLYRIQAIPSNFIIDPNGVIVAKNIRGADLEDFLNKTFNKPQ